LLAVDWFFFLKQDVKKAWAEEAGGEVAVADGSFCAISLG